MQQHGSKCLPTDPPPLTLGMGSIGQKSTFSQLCHVAYQIKWNHKILLQTPTPINLGVWVTKVKFHFQNMVMLHIKLK